MFGTMPERMVLAAGDTQGGDDMMKAVVHAITATFSMNPTPQIIKPAMEAYFNEDSFRGRDIDGMGDMQKEAGQRYSRNTSDLFRSIGAQFNVSPKRLEHVWKGYTGTMGAYVLSTTDMMLRAATGAPVKPSLRPRDIPVLKSFYRDTDNSASATAYGDKFYEMLKDSQEAYATFRHFQNTGRGEEAQEYRADKATELKSRRGLASIQRQLRALNKQIDIISRSKTMSAERKREKLEVLQRRKNELTSKGVNRYGS